MFEMMKKMFYYLRKKSSKKTQRWFFLLFWNSINDFPMSQTGVGEHSFLLLLLPFFLFLLAFLVFLLFEATEAPADHAASPPRLHLQGQRSQSGGQIRNFLSTNTLYVICYIKNTNMKMTKNNSSHIIKDET